MSQPTSPGQVIDLSFTRRPSIGLAKPSRQNSAASEKTQDVGLDRRAQGHRLAGVQPVVIKRKQLPWLAKKEGTDIEGGKGVSAEAGGFELAHIGQGPLGVTRQSGLGNPQGAAPSTASAGTASLGGKQDRQAPNTEVPNSVKRPSIASLGHDMSVRAVGSTRSMDQGEKQVRPQRSLSLGAELRPGVKPLRSKHQAKQAFGLEKTKKVDLEDYTASEYSTTVSSSDVEHPPTIPITKPRQVQKAADRKEHLSRHEPGPSLKQQWIRGRLPPSHAELAPGAVKHIPSHLLTSTDVSNSPRDISPKNTVKPRPIPHHPPPIATASHDLRRETRKMDTAIRDHEKIMAKAFGAADEAAGRGHSNEVARILEGASSALHNASTTALYRRSTTRPINSPLRLSPSESGLSTDGEFSDDHDLWDLQHSREQSAETAPTLVTASSSKSPLLAAPYTKD
ncbi:hypothetical protein KC336_g19490, partial [Hortaea werneckii]